MLAAGTAETSPMAIKLKDLQGENILLPLPVLLAAALLIVLGENHFQHPWPVVWPGLTFAILAPLVAVLRTRSHHAASWLLALGSLLGTWLLVSVTGIPAAIHLFALPVGLAALFVGVSAGAAMAAGVTALLLLLPARLVPPDQMARPIALIGTWGTVGLIYLTLRPLVTTMQWSWSSYEQSRRLLDKARDYQVQLKQTLHDLADANLQLTRLNRLAQGLRLAAEEARRAKEQFVANVSHELRTPLNMILGFSEMILQAPKTYGSKVPPALLADLAVISRNSQHLASLIDDVLDMSRIEAGQMALTREWVALREIIEAAVVAVRPLFETKNLYLETEVPEDSTVFCDRTRIREVVLNLLSNAGRFTQQGGVRVYCRREGGDMVVSVADTGPGIADQDRDKLFQPFQQLDGSLRRRYDGTGLGLAISKSFVELHGGRMWLESASGMGTTFCFRLPAEPPEPAGRGASRWFSPYWQYEERARASQAPIPTVHPRFVVLETGDTLQRLVARYLGNVEIAPAGSLEEALQELSRLPAQALLANSPSVGEALHTLKGSPVLPYGTPAIICSIPGVGEAAGALSVDEYLIKPISQDRLLAALERLDLGGKKVLVVDDEPEAQQLFWRMLVSANLGYRVLTAASGQEALALLREEQPDVVLLDLVMPEMDGFQLLEARAQDPSLRQIPVIVISARDPAGQPVVSDALAVTRGGGLSVPQLLACIEAISRVLGTAGQAADPAPRAGRHG